MSQTHPAASANKVKIYFNCVNDMDISFISEFVIAKSDLRTQKNRVPLALVPSSVPVQGKIVTSNCEPMGDGRVKSPVPDNTVPVLSTTHSIFHAYPAIIYHGLPSAQSVRHQILL